MATIFSDDFESYADGEDGSDGENPTNFGSVWSVGDLPNDVTVTAGIGLGGSQAAYNEDGAISKDVSDGSDASGSVEAWSYKDSTLIEAKQHGLEIAVIHGASAVFLAFYNPGAGERALHPEWTGSNAQSLVLYNVWTNTYFHIPNIYRWDTYQHFRFMWKMSTVLPDGSDVAADGCARVYVDDTLVASLTGQKIALENTGWVDASSQNEWLGVYFSWGGRLDNVVVSNDAVTCGGSGTTTPGTVPPTSTPCCGSEPPSVPPGPVTPNPPGTPPTTQPGPVAPPNPFIPLPPWVSACAGGGTVPTASDLTDAEDWSV